MAPNERSRFAEDLSVAFAELRDTHPLQGGEFLGTLISIVDLVGMPEISASPVS
jgi:hypothetical protein